MRNLSIILLLLFCKISTGQVAAIVADPSIGTLIISTNAGGPIPVIPINTISISEQFLLKIPLSNLSSTNYVPAGSVRVLIGLGSKMGLVPSFNVANANSNNYFDWSSELLGGQYQIRGELRVDLPAGYRDTTYLNVTGLILGTSTITANFLITNHNTAIATSDLDPLNNTQSLPYLVENSLPVKFKNFVGNSNDCLANIVFETALEENVKHFVVQYSNNGVQFFDLETVLPNRSMRYQIVKDISNLNLSDVAFFRVKSEDLNGAVDYTHTISVNVKCNNDGCQQLKVFPNPITTQSILYIHSKQSFKSGKYFVAVSDLLGRRLQQDMVVVQNDGFLKIAIRNIESGKYFINITKDGVILNNKVIQFVVVK